jgi:cytochrome subunit of sulfide dehydrogenase
MIKRNTLSASLFMLLSMGLHTAASAEAPDLATGMLVNTCVACHGPSGSSHGPAIPSIAGMSHDTFMNAMTTYKSDERKETIMNRIAKGYSEADFEVMAAYFAKQEFVRFPQETDSKKAKAGARLHKQQCENCHADNGFTDEDGSSILAGQWLPYLQASLSDFHKGERDMPKKMADAMKAVTKKGGEESLEQLAHFYASQTKKP